MFKCPKRRISNYVDVVFVPKATFVRVFSTSHFTTRSKFTYNYKESVTAEQGRTEGTLKFYY
jgi:hypothetical protein